MIAKTWTRWLGTQFLAARDALSIREMLHVTAARHGNWSLRLVLAIYAGCLVAFVTDLTSTNTAAFGVFYAPLIATAVFHRDKRSVWVLTAIACGMNVIGALFPIVPNDLAELVENRALSTLALLATAAFTWHARKIQDQLIRQTSRAAAAERMKTEVLTNLSQEIRAPLYSMIGVLELVAADSRPDQKAALGVVRTSGRRLVTTLDNLVDLTQFEGQAMPAEPFDLGQLVRQTAEARRQDAAARQIELIIDIASVDAPPRTPPSTSDGICHANPWAVRRILENKIMDAISFTAPGGRVEVSIEAERSQVSAVIVATGRWPAGAFHSAVDLDVIPLSPSIMGLVLSQRLARAMGARLVLSNGPGEGTTVRLQLPTTSTPLIKS